MDIEAYLEALASASPTPGGGSAATVVGALAASLVAMVARITAENQSYAQRADAARILATDADALRTALVEARNVDEHAYGRVVAAMALPKTTPDEKTARTLAVQAALADAATAPLRAAALAAGVLELARRARALENRHLESDVTCASIFAGASLAASAANVRINHAYLKDADLVRTQEAALRQLEAESP